MQGLTWSVRSFGPTLHPSQAKKRKRRISNRSCTQQSMVSIATIMHTHTRVQHKQTHAQKNFPDPAKRPSWTVPSTLRVAAASSLGMFDRVEERARATNVDLGHLNKVSTLDSLVDDTPIQSYLLKGRKACLRSERAAVPPHRKELPVFWTGARGTVRGTIPTPLALTSCPPNKNTPREHVLGAVPRRKRLGSKGALSRHRSRSVPLAPPWNPPLR